MGQHKPPESNADRYRKRAAELRALAKASRYADTQRELLLIARQYETLAADVKRGGRNR